MALSKARISRRWESLLREVLEGPPGADSWVYAASRGHEAGDPRVPHLRRARITPEQAGLASYGSRRVPGLRREEVAVLAGVSVPYYTRLERGDMSGASESVLEALARALQLDDAERAHLFDLARAAHPTPARPRRRQTKARVRPEVQRTLDAITGAAAFVGNERLDIRPRTSSTRAVLRAVPRTPGRLTPPGSSSLTREPRRPTATGPRRHRIRRHPVLCRRPRPIQPRPFRPRRRAGT